MDYVLVRAETGGTTGYFCCEPEPGLSLEQGLSLLENWENDSFLAGWLARALPGPETQEFQALFARFAGSRIISGFLSGHTARAEATGQSLTRAWLDNISQHRPLDLPEPGSGGSAEYGQLFRQRRKILADLRAAWPESAREVQTGQQEFLERILGLLSDSGLLAGPEMRHEASLSPIALLREWQLDTGSAYRKPYRLRGRLFAYGRGLALVQARISCLMEIVERASAFAPVDSQGCIYGQALVCMSAGELAGAGLKYFDPGGLSHADEGLALHWLKAESHLGEPVLVPAQAACLFLNLDEPALFDWLGSTGLGAGATREQARLAALLEVIERDSQATVPFTPRSCFVPASRDPILQGLLDDYRFRGIYVQMQDITTEIGVPAYRCFVTGRDGEVRQATGAALSGKTAAIAALTETPWPYSWAGWNLSPSGAGLSDLPVRFLEDLPDYSLPGHGQSLQLLEQALSGMGLEPVYADLTRPDLGLPVCRAFVAGLDPDPELERGLSPRLLARYLEAKNE